MINMKKISRMDKAAHLNARQQIEAITKLIEKRSDTSTLNEILDLFYDVPTRQDMTCEE